MQLKDTFKKKRYFHRISTGQTLARYRKKKVRFITLTTSDKGRTLDLARDFDVLIKRIRRKDKNFQYCKITTNEGNGVIHLLYTGKYITHKWLVWNWTDIHDSYIVDIRQVKEDKSVAIYLINQYLSNQKCSFTKMSMSKYWMFPGAVKVWKNLCEGVKSRYFYNCDQNKYYRKRIEVPFKEIMGEILDRWDAILYKTTFRQTCIMDYG